MYSLGRSLLRLEETKAVLLPGLMETFHFFAHSNVGGQLVLGPDRRYDRQHTLPCRRRTIGFQATWARR